MNSEISSQMNRRDVLSKAVAGAGAGLVLGAPGILKAAGSGGSNDIHVALVGFGKQGHVLFECLKNIPGLHFQAVCDISLFNRQWGVGQVRYAKGNTPNGYEDIDEMLSKEKGLDAVVIATPDFWHSPHTVKCLEAGLHVYCEKMMSNTIDGARAMVRAMEKSGKLCQIGYQRRSNPRYRYVYEKLLLEHKICGRIINANAQWKRTLISSMDIGDNQIARRLILPKETLKRYGFKDMHQLLNWRVYRDLSGGPISDFGANQIDIFNWFFGGPPKSVFASGGNDYFKKREHFDNVMCIFDYETPEGGARAFCQVLTTVNLSDEISENFMGIEGSIKISQIASETAIYREGGAGKSWDEYVRRNILKKAESLPKPPPSIDAVPSYASLAPEGFDLPGGFKKPVHQPHLENFFASVRGQEKLNCDARQAFESEASIYWVNPSALSRQPIQLNSTHLSV